MKRLFSLVAMFFCLSLLFTGCSVIIDFLNPIPEKYIEGVKVPRAYPDDDFEIYDDAIVFEVDEDDDEITLEYGTEDDVDDVMDYYENLFEDNDLIVEEKEYDRDEFYAAGRGDGFAFEVEIYEPRGETLEKLFAAVVEVTIEFVDEDIVIEAPEETDTQTATPTVTPENTDDADDDSYIIDVTTLTDDELAYYISDTVWYYIEYVADGEVQDLSNGQLIYYSDGTLEDTFDDELNTGNWYVSGNRLYCDYTSGKTVNWAIGVQFRGSENYLIYYSSDNQGAFWRYSTYAKDSITSYTSNADVSSAIAGITMEPVYYMYSDGSIESMYDNPITFYYDGTFEEIYKGMNYTGTWQVSDGYITYYYDGGDSTSYPVFVEYNAVNGYYYLYLGDLEEGYEDCYWVYSGAVQ